MNDSMQIREHETIGYSDRNPFARDYSRILYSSAFRRLQGKMQILGINSAAFYRNRLTHSLEVEQIAHSTAKRIALSVGLPDEMYNDDIQVIHAAALAHDIGHPAFGHKGESVLNELAHRYGLNFEGNAQNFKILRTLEKKDATNKGLNLTRRTLLAINKYNIREDGKRTKFLYSDDYNVLNKMREQCNLSYTRTLDVQIIELADDIAYAVHDLEDALSLGLFTIDDILFEISRNNEDCHLQLRGIVDEARKYALQSNSYNTQEEYSKVFRCKLTSLLTDRFVTDITLKSVTKKEADSNGIDEKNSELTLDKYKSLCKTLKTTIFNGVMRSPEVSVYELRGEAIIKSLFYLYAIDDRNANCRLLPMEYRPKPTNKGDEDDKYRFQRERIQNSIDYIAGMMDTYAIKEYEKYFSIPFDSISLKQVNEVDKKLDVIEHYRIERMSFHISKSEQNSMMEISASKIDFQQRH